MRNSRIRGQAPVRIQPRQTILEGEAEAAKEDWVRQEQDEGRDEERVVLEKAIRTELVANEKAAREQCDSVFGSRLFAVRGCYSRAHDCPSPLATRAGISISGRCTTARCPGLAR